MNEDFENFVVEGFDPEGYELNEDFDLDVEEDFEPDIDEQFEWSSSMGSVGWGTDEDYGDWNYSNDY